MSSDESDYLVEEYVVADKVTVPLINDERADILGNFDDSKRYKNGSYKYPDEIEDDQFTEIETDDESSSASGTEEEVVDDVGSKNGDVSMEEEAPSAPPAPLPINTKLTKEQIQLLQRGASKTNRFVMYVTSLDFGTTKEVLEDYFASAGAVKGVRIPRNRKGGFAFVEMVDIDGFQKAFELHNTVLEGKTIKVQMSEAGKKKSANKKNIMKMKNRKLAEMRNEPKKFSKSGKNYDKGFKKEMEEHKMEQLRASGRGRGRGRGRGGLGRGGRGASRGRGRGGAKANKP